MRGRGLRQRGANRDRRVYASRPMVGPDSNPRAPGLRLLALSAIALFLELTVIRWAPSAAPIVAYYANLMLISSFLGLGVGAMLATSRRRFLGWFAPLLLVDVA